MTAKMHEVTAKRTPTLTSIPAALRRSSLFGDVSDATIDAIAVAARVRAVARNSILILEGDRPSSMFVVVDGLLRVFTTSLEGTEPTLTVLLPGDHVGELGALHDTPRSASVGALRPSTVIEVPNRAFIEAYERDGTLARTLVTHLAARLRSTSTRLVDLTILGLGARLAKYLATEMTTSRADGSPPFVELAFTQSELGQLLGGARQSINQELSALERDGIIAMDGRRIDVVDPAALRRRANAL
jgi:CRP/FNR family transcriptional regulator, cyclic AMP receptor protein